MSLIDKIRKARESTIEADGHIYTIRRPTDAEAMQLGKASGLDVVKRFVVGWDHSTLSLGIPGGDSVSIEFDSSVWGEWVEDQPQVWEVLAQAVIGAYTTHRANQEASEKN